MNRLHQDFRSNWEEKNFPLGTNPFLLALSGGLDSMVLAHLLLEHRIPFAAAHCNFSLRGKEADNDARFVADWCAEKGIVCHQTAFATREIADSNGWSIQVAARHLRYEWFEGLRKMHHYTAILTAHHADDVAETMLINLARGTGIAGLHGIPERKGYLIRPLLFATRAQIREYAEANGIAWREDASNAEDKYLRNAIRLQIMPLLEKLLPGAGSRIAETAGRVRQAESIYRKVINHRLKKLTEQRGNDWYVPVRLLKKQEDLPIIAYELFTPFGFSASQVTEIVDLLDAPSGKQVIGTKHRVLRHRDFLVITTSETGTADLIQIDEIPSTVNLAEGIFSFSWAAPGTTISKDENTAMLHGDDLALPLSLRKRREGDYFYPLGMGGKKKKLKRFLIDVKMPVHEKERLNILEDAEKRILWIAGKRIDERAKCRPSTQKILEVTFTPHAEATTGG